MKTRKIMAFLVSASMSFNVLASSAVDIVSADELDDVTLQEVPESLEETDTVDNETEIEEEVISDIDDTEIIEEEIEGIPEEISDAIDAAPFSEEAEVDGVIISVSADEGVFPEGAYMGVTRVYDPEADALVMENIDEDSDVAYTYTFDITVFDSEGNEIEPDTEAGCVYVSFTNEFVSDPNLDMDIYHITEDDVVELDFNIDEDMAIASTDGFSYYSIVFTRETSYEYHINNYTLLTANALATHVGLNGEVTSASSEDTDKVNVYADTNDTWFVDVNGPFDGTVNVTLTIASTDYTIGVTTDTTVYSTGDDGQMGFRLASSGKGFDVYGYANNNEVNTTYQENGRSGYRTRMSVDGVNPLTFHSTNDNFALGKVYTQGGVEAYLTAEVIDGAVYVTYTMTNTGTDTVNVRIGSGCDCKIGGNDFAVVEEYNGGLIMRESLRYASDINKVNSTDDGATFYLTSGIGEFSTLYSDSQYDGVETKIFSSGVNNVFNCYTGSTIGIDSAICYSWNLNIAPGETARRVAVFSITDSANFYNVTYYPNNDNSADKTYSASMMANIPAQLNANRFTAPSGLAFKGWAASATGPVLYADEATVTPTGSMNLYAIWKPVASISSTPSPSSSPMYTGAPVELVDPNNAGSSADGTVVYSTDGGSTWSTDIPTATDPGNYTVQYKVAGDDDHADSTTGSFDVTVLSAPEAITGLVYTGADQALINAPSAMPTGYEEVWYSLDGENWEDTIPVGKDVDTYNVQYKFVDTDGNENDITGSITVNISKATASIGTSQMPQAVDTQFTGDAIDLVIPPVAAPLGYDVLYSTDGTNWNTTVPSETHVGNYTIYYKFDGDENHNDISDDSYMCTSHITAATPTDSQKPTANDGAYVEGGRPLVRAPESSISGVTVEYRTEGTTWSTEIPKGGYGSHTVYYRYVDEDGNEDYAGGTIDVEVSQAAAPTSLTDDQKPTVNNLVYTGNDQPLVTSPAATDYPDGYDTLLYKDENGDWVTDIPTGNDAGNYTVEFRYEDSTGNHAPIEGTIENINIRPASGYGTVTDEQRPHAVDGTITYDGTAQTLVTDEGMTSYPAGYNDVMYRIGGTGDWSSELPSETNAGDYVIYVKYIPADSNHVEFIDSVTIPVSIEKAPVTITVNADQGMRYGETEPALEASVDYKPASGADVIYSISREAGTDVGTYAITVTATEEDNPNYEITVNNNATFTISQATAPSADSLDPEQKPTVVNTTFDPNGVALANGPTEALPYYTVEYSLNGTDWSEEIPTADHVGYYEVYYRYNGDANHADAEGGSFTSHVTAATPSDSQKPTANNTTFVDQDVPLVNNPTTPVQGATVQYSTNGTDWSPTPPTGGAGTYEVQYRYVDADGNENYAGGTIDVTITQASAGAISDSQKPTAVNTTFDPNGVALANTPATALSGYTVEYSLNGTDWSEEIPTANHVGYYEVYYRYNGDANHADAEGGSFTSHVTAATPTNSQKPTANNTTFVDQDVPLVNNPTTPVQGATVQYRTNGTDWSSTPPTGGAGRYEVQYRYVDADGNENYAGGTISVEVSQAPAPSLTDAQKPTVNSLHYTGNDQELVTSPAATDYPQGYDTLLYKDENGAWVSAIPTGDDATNYTVEFRYEDSTGNREPIEGTVPVTIAPAAAPNASDVNDNEKPTPISGLTYTGSAQNLVTPPSTLPEGYDQVWYRTDDGNEWSQTIPTGTDAGDYEVSVKYVDSFGNHEDLTGVTVTGKINPAASAFAFLTEDNKPHAASGLYYTSNPQVLVVGPSEMPANYETIEYSVDGGNTWVTEPTGTENGTYTVAYRYIDEDGNYQPITGGSLTATIYAAAAPDPSTLTDEQKPHAVADLVYDGQSHELVSAPAGTLPNNYEKVMYSTDGGTTWSDAIPTRTSADDYTVNYKYVDNDGAYSDLIVPDSIPVSIAPAPAPDVDTLPDDQKPAAIDGLEYTGSAQDLIDRDTPATLPDGYDQIWYSTDGGSTWSQNIPTGTDAGEYEILYKYVDADGDHEDITGGSVTVSIAPADAPSADSLTDANKPSAVDDLAYTGSAQNLVTPPSTLPEGYDQVWYSTDGGNTWSQTIPTGTDAGDYEVSVKYVDSNGNHDDLTGVTVPVTIAPAEAPDASSLTAAQKPTAVNGLAYTGSEQELVNAPSSLPAGYDEVWYSTDGGNTWSQDIPTGIEADNYTVSVKYVDADGNYEDLTGINVPVTIAQEAAPELTDAQKPSAVSGLTYTGSAQALVSAPASLPDGYEQVWYSLDGGNTWTQTIPTGTDAGTYTISVRYVDTDGIKADILGSDIIVTIAAGTTTAVINGVAKTVTIGSTLARPEDPTRYGYDFTGWFADEACTIPYNFNTPIGVNGVTLYAGWAQVSYSLTEGAGSTWSGNSTLTFRAVRNRLEPTTFSHFTGIQVDGKTVAPENYQAKSGSVIVILSESYLKTLSVGEHTLDIMFDDAPSVRSTFIIGEAQVASTGESMYSICTVLGALLIASAAGFVIFSLRHEEA